MKLTEMQSKLASIASVLSVRDILTAKLSTSGAQKNIAHIGREMQMIILISEGNS